MTTTEQKVSMCIAQYPCILAHLQKEVSLLYNTINIPSDIDFKSYPLKIISKIVQILNTLWNVICKDEDFFVANIIIRSLADQISSLLLIYNINNGEISLLRHYLFILDGIHNRLSNIIVPRKDASITEEEYSKLIKQQRDFKTNLNGAKTIIQKISLLNIYNTHKQNIEALKRNKKGEERYNWKFIKFDVPVTQINDKNNTYKWESMYSLLNMPGQEKFFSPFQSDYVHGLSMSNIEIEPNFQSMGTLTYITVKLMGCLERFIHNFYKDNI